MHEFSIAGNIVEIVTENAKKAASGEVQEIELEIGELSGIVIDALTLALASTVKGTIMENAKINILRVKGKVRCHHCSAEYYTDDILNPCPQCGDFGNEIIEGKEMRVKSIEVN